MRLCIFLFFLLVIPLYGAQEFTVNLKDPEYQNGVISTHAGGVISSPELRVQARHIVYTNRMEKGETIHRVVAEGNLMLDSGGHTYVGRRLEYDFVTKTGVVYDGVTAIDLWFLGGEKIRLNSDRSFYLYNAFVTTTWVGLATPGPIPPTVSPSKLCVHNRPAGMGSIRLFDTECKPIN